MQIDLLEAPTCLIALPGASWHGRTEPQGDRKLKWEIEREIEREIKREIEWEIEREIKRSRGGARTTDL